MTRPALNRLVEQVRAVVPGPDSPVRVGVEAAGHYHQPLIAPNSWPDGWQIRELNPAHVTEQRRVMGRRRVKTDAIDLEAITELLLAGRGEQVTALGDPNRWPGPAQVYRAAGLSPMRYESVGRRRDGGISREGSVPVLPTGRGSALAGLG
jgi:transposase